MTQPEILNQPPEFSLVLGGPLFNCFRRARLSGEALELARRRVVVIAGVAWLPLLLLALIVGHALAGALQIPFLYDIEAHVRFLGALPILIVAEVILHARIRPSFLTFATLISLQAQLTTWLLINRATRHRAGEASQPSVQRYRNVVETQTELICRVLPDTTLTFVNDAYCRYFGKTREELIGTKYTQLILEHARNAAPNHIASLIENPRTETYEHEVVLPNGDPTEAEEALLIAHDEVNRVKNRLQEENIQLQDEIELSHNADEIIGESNAIKYVLFKIEQVAHTDTTVLILGETGTGKELVAHALHSQSRRKDRPLIKVNCAALSTSLIESELFGHEKGAFTGAGMHKIGRFELADGATLFLDEIGELPLELQPKLLRVIQEGELERLGSSKTIKVDVRIIAATNRNMTLEVEKGAFREDLWYRLNVFPITLPPLRRRKEDIPALVKHFVSTFSKKVGKGITSISATSLKKLQDHSWPGNVRELANVIERGVIYAQGPILRIADQFSEVKPADRTTVVQTLEEVEKQYVIEILDQTAWRIEGPSGAARALGLNPSTLRTRMVKLGIQKSIRSIAEKSQTTS
jgi:PAS domain S-box-containing protein